jgi:hypothetical protein
MDGGLNIKFNYIDLSKFQNNTVCDETIKLDYNDYLHHKKNRFNNSKKDFDSYESIILILDFPYLGGGTTVFLDSIIAKYKTSQTLAILRNYNEKITLSINDEFIVDEFLNEKIAFEFLMKNKDKIKKIFINHTLNYSNVFIEKLFLLDKEVTTITHDYLWINNNAQNYYTRLVKNIENNDASSYKWRNVDKIITQNIENLRIFSQFHNKDRFIISELPDFKKSQKHVVAKNKKIVVAIIGAISEIKGKSLVKIFLEIFKNSPEVEIVVLGECNINATENKNNIYADILEFNELLIKFKPNIILETSMWPETYSYTLTLAMLTQLPIIGIKKPFPSVIENRLKNYEKALFFNTLNEAINLIKNVKQDYFYTIDPTIYFNDFWNNYFTDVSQTISLENDKEDDDDVNSEAAIAEEEEEEDTVKFEKNVVFVSSKIYVSNNNFTHSKIRSIYSTEDRFEQTIKTITSIRKYIPDSYIILFDNSDFSSEYFEKLFNMVDLFINITTDETLNLYTNVKKTKVYGELAQTSKALDYFANYEKNFTIKQFFKISGRYLINETFNYSQYENDKNIFKKNNDVVDRNYFYTSFYKINGKNFNAYHDNIKKTFEESIGNDIYDSAEFEVLIPKKLNYDFIETDNLGITQNISIWNQRDKI